MSLMINTIVHIVHIHSTHTMSTQLRKKAAKQQKRISALNSPLVHTPANSRPASSDEDAWSDVSGSTVDSYTSTGSRAFDDDAIITNWEDELKQSIEDLGEKRTSTRESALVKYTTLLSRKYAAPLIESQHHNLVDLLKRCIKRPGNTRENVLAARAVSLTFINHGDIGQAEQEELYQEVLPMLKYIITNIASAEVKASCLQSLSITTFIAASTADSIDCLNFFYEILQSAGHSVHIDDVEDEDAMTIVMASAARGYGLLYAVIWGDGRGRRGDAWDEFEKSMPAHLKLLDSISMEVRVASGENIALMFESIDLHNNDPENSDEDDAALPQYDDIDNLMARLQNLATDSNRRRNKKERASQRSAFRDIVRTVEGGERPTEKFKFRRSAVHFTGWSKIVELAAFRETLKEGLSVHFEENELLQTIFSYSPDHSHFLHSPRPGSVMSAAADSDRDLEFESSVDRKHLNSEMSKLRSKELKKLRKSKRMHD
ncbi:interferon-related developmental regulator-domain-containing protein [Jimgerdemannia flammicorona]|uniref:Interferon-related developmental regulator-domain-containing protein n=1 Tax=Jimgerdemannia flammicorona TaxID=994334 RepID=A0A433Q8C3_9FUNG|nr:interferon-related developmental regulator-domain-containing protein [Jimgerdemannia flammicorona]